MHTPSASSVDTPQEHPSVADLPAQTGASSDLLTPLSARLRSLGQAPEWACTEVKRLERQVALLRAAQPAPSVADGMARYLRSARSRGVPQSVCDEVLALVEDAELLGYFLASETAPSTSPLQAQAAHEDQSH